jgi:pimeloyl-ACP methyl ester carboxylesterase
VNKTSLILVPGLLCDATAWTPQVAALSGIANIRVADLPQCDSLGAMAEAILATAPERFALAGHSMGGRIALEVMRRAPERVERLALMDTGYEPVSRGEAGEREAAGRQRMVAKARELGMRAMGFAWLQGMLHPRRLSDATLVASILDMIERRTPDYYAAQTRAMLSRPDATPLLAGITCSTLVVCGQEDAWSPVERHRRLAKLIPGSTLSIIEDCGHMSTLEQPGAVAAALRSWLI